MSNDVPELSFVDFPKRPYICEGLSVKFSKIRLILPVSLEDNTLTLIVEEPEDVDTLDAVRVATGFDLKIFKGKREEIERAIDKFYVSSNTVNEIVGGIATGENGTFAGAEEDVDHLRDMASEAPIVRLVNLIITKAIESRASDIHIEPFEDTLRVRYRIDDILQEVESLPRHLHAAVTSRIKIMAYLNIAERRLPQDGRIKMRVSGHDVDFRVATIPTASW